MTTPTVHPKKRRVLFVPDSLYWVTATIARQISRYNEWIEPTLCSPHVLQMILDSHAGSYPGQIDLIHFVTQYGTGAFKPAFYATTPWVVTIHHIENDLMAAPANDADAIMTVCHEWHDKLIARGISSQKCIMVPNGVDTELFCPASQERKAKLRKEYGIPENSVCVGFSGKRSSDSSNRKGIATLARAMQSVSGHKNISFAIMGPGWDDLVHEQRQRGAHCAYIPFLVDRGEVADFYKLIDFYWVTSRIEGGPVPLLEAMSTGVTCLSTPVGAAIDAIVDQANGFVAPFEEPDYYAALTRRLAGMPCELRRIGQSARETIVNRFDERQTTKNVARLYDIADRNFELRRGGSVVSRSLTRASLPYGLRRRALAEEHLAFFNYLMKEGAYDAAGRVARRAIASNPLSLDIWRRALTAWSKAHRIFEFGYRTLEKFISAGRK